MVVLLCCTGLLRCTAGVVLLDGVEDGATCLLCVPDVVCTLRVVPLVDVDLVPLCTVPVLWAGCGLLLTLV